jgi:hypothetical protein
MDDISELWGWVPLIGMFVLGGVMIFGIFSNHRHSSAREIERTERATKAARDETDRETTD